MDGSNWVEHKKIVNIETDGYRSSALEKMPIDSIFSEVKRCMSREIGDNFSKWLFTIHSLLMLEAVPVRFSRLSTTRRIFALTAQEGGKVENTGAIFTLQNLHFRRPCRPDAIVKATGRCHAVS